MSSYIHNSKKPEYLYHCTQSKTKKLIWEPREFGDNRCDEEPDIPRICCSLSVAGCLVALGHCLDSFSKIRVLRTKNKVHYYTPTSKEVIDSKITKEVWRLKKTVFEEVSVIKFWDLDYEAPYDLFQIHTGTKEALKKQKIMIKILQKYLKKI